MTRRSTVLSSIAGSFALIATGCASQSPSSEPINVGLAYTAPSADEYRCYAISWEGDLYSIDLKTGAVALVRRNVCTGANAMTTMPDGTLLIVSSYNDQLIRFHPTTQVTESVTQMPETADIRALAALPDGRILGVQSPSGSPRRNTLVEIDANTGESAPLTTLDTETVQSLEASRDGTLYAYDNYKKGLMSINPVTGVATSRQTFFPPGVFQSIAFLPSGNLIGYTHNQTNHVVRAHALYSISTSNGALNLITRVYGKRDFRGIAIVPPIWQSDAPPTSSTDTRE